MYANEDDDFWNSNERPKPADQSETQTKKITYSSSSNEEDIDDKEQGLGKSKHMKDEKNTKEQIGEHHCPHENNKNKPDKAAIYDKLFQNLEQLKPRRFDESKLLEDQSDTDDNHQQTFSTKNESDGLKENHKSDSSSNSSDSEAHSSASSTGRKHVSRRKSQDQESSSDRKDRETSKESSTHDCQGHESAKRDYNRSNQTSEDEKHSGDENGQKSKMKLSKKSRKAKKERSPSLSRSDRDLHSFLRIKNQHQFNAFDKSTKENICKWVKENTGNQLARKKRDEKRRENRQKKSDAEEYTKSPDRTSKKPKKRRQIPAARPRSSSDPGEERSRDAEVPRRSRSQPRTRKELRSGEFDWSTSKNDEIRSWLKEKARLLRKKRVEEKKKRRMERKMKEEKQRQRDEKFADSSERVSEWTKQKMEQERLKRKKQKEEILREKERQEQRSTKRSADYHKLRPNNNLNPSFGLRAKGQVHVTKRQELPPLLKQREKQRQTVLRNSAKRLDSTSSVFQLGKEDKRRQLPSQRNSEKLEEMSVHNRTGIPNLQSPPARIHSTAKPGEQYPVRRSISLSRIRIPKENEKGNVGQTKLKKKITFDEWLGKKNDNELKRQVLEKKKLDADIKVPQNAGVDVTPSTEEERVKDMGRPRPKSSRQNRQTSGERDDKAKNSPIAHGNNSALVCNPHINGGMDILGTSLRAKSPKPEVDVRPQSSAVKYQRDSWNGFSDYLWDQVNEQEGGELINSRDMVRLQVTSAETDKLKDNQQRVTVKNSEKVVKSPSLFEDKEGHENIHELNEIKTKGLKNETEISNKVDRITPAHLLGGTTVHRAMKTEAEVEYNSKYSSFELKTGSAKDNGFNSYAEKSDIHTIIDADEEEFEPVMDPKQESLDSENLGMGTRSLTRHIATQQADYEVLPKTSGPYPVMRNESNTSDIEEDIVSDFDVTGSKSSKSSL